MIKWCAYCQAYIEEVKPYDSYTLSHGICEKCLADPNAVEEEAIRRMQSAKDLYTEIIEAAKRGDLISSGDLLAKAKQLGIEPVDLTFGFLQPILHQIGILWEQGALSPAKEHQFTGFAESAMERIFSLYPEKEIFRQSKTPKFLNVCATDNCHFLGLRMVELFLVTHDIPVYTICPNLPPSHIKQLVEQLEPQYVGLSISIPNQIKGAIDIHKELQENSSFKNYQMICGGAAIRNGFRFPPEMNIKHLIRIEELLDL